MASAERVAPPERSVGAIRPANAADLERALRPGVHLLPEPQFR
jgi:hypothetical protein